MQSVSNSFSAPTEFSDPAYDEQRMKIEELKEQAITPATAAVASCNAPVDWLSRNLQLPLINVLPGDNTQALHRETSNAPKTAFDGSCRAW